jgi:hypothetical protein
MHNEHGQAIADHWAKGDVYGLILSALEKAGKSPETLSVKELAPIDHFHTRGFSATVDLPTGYPSNQTTPAFVAGQARSPGP